VNAQKIATQLQAEFGAVVCSQDSDVIARASADPWLMHAGRAAAVMRPRTVEEVVAIVRWCQGHGVAIVPQGGNTGLAGGATPDTSGRQVVLSLSRLNRVRELDAANYTATVEAGCVLASVQAAAQAADRLFPLSFGAEGSCQIGGVLSTNAGGTNTLRYGNARDLVLGLEVVLADGSIWSGLRKLRKDNTGYDLRHLFMGAEGTLGIITAATLKLFPAPKASQTILVALTDLPSSVSLLSRARERLGDALSAFELMPRRFIALVHEHLGKVAMPPAAHRDWFALLEFDAADAESLVPRVQSLLESALVQEEIVDAAIAVSEAQRKQFWQLRDGVSEAQLRHGAVIYTDVSVAVSDVPAFIAAASAALRQFDPGVDINAFGHVGDGNVHFNLLQPSGCTAHAFLAQKEALLAIIYATVRAWQGSISAEHGIGQAKVVALEAHKSPLELALMRSIRQVLAQNTFNPDKVVALTTEKRT